MVQQEMEPRFARPAHEVRIGLVRGAVWANRGENGVRYHVTFDRRYRHGEEWKTATSFGRDDLLTLAKVANEAHSWITQQKGSKGGSQEASETAGIRGERGEREVRVPRIQRARGTGSGKSSGSEEGSRSGMEAANRAVVG